MSRELQFIKPRLLFFTNCSSSEPEESVVYLYRTELIYYAHVHSIMSYGVIF
jgi:hypothetical protein